MTEDNKTNTQAKASPSDEMKRMGRKIDPSIKAAHPAVADKEKIGDAIGSIADLTARLEKLNSGASGPFGNDDVDFVGGNVGSLFEDDSVKTPAPAVSDNDLDDLLVEEKQVAPASTTDDDVLDLDSLLGEDGVTAPVATQQSSAEASFDDVLTGAMVEDDSASDTAEELDELEQDEEDEEDGKSSPFSAIFNAKSDEDDLLSDEGHSEYDLFDEFDELNADDFEDDESEIDPRILAEIEEDFRAIEEDDDLPQEAPWFSEPGAIDAEILKNLPSADDLIEEDRLREEEGFFEDDEDDFFEDEEDLFHLDEDRDAHSSHSDISDLPEPSPWDDDDLYAPGTTGEDEGSSASSDLPEPSMWEDDGIYAPGTSYDDDGDDDSFEDGADTFGHAAHETDKLITKKDDTMSNAGKSSQDTEFDFDDLDLDAEEQSALEDISSDGEDSAAGSEADTLNSEESFDASGLDDLFQDKDEPEAAESEKEDIAETAAQSLKSISDKKDAEEGAKKKGSKGLLLAAASVLVLGGGGFAAFKGMIPGVDMAAMIQSSAAPVAPAAGVAPAEQTTVDVASEKEAPAVDTETPVDMAEVEPEPEVDLADPVDIKVPAEESAKEEVPASGKLRLSDLAKMAEEPEEEEVIIAIPDSPIVMDDAEAVMVEAPVETAVDEDTPAADTPAADAPVETPESAIAALAAEIDTMDEKKAASEIKTGPVSRTNSVFVEAARVDKVEGTISDLETQVTDLTNTITQMNGLMVEAMERNALLASRVGSNERTLRTTTDILAEFAKVKTGLDKTQIVVLEMASRLADLEYAEPVEKSELTALRREVRAELTRMSQNLEMMTNVVLDGVSVMSSSGARADRAGVRTTVSEESLGLTGSTYTTSDTSAGAVDADPIVSPNVKKGDIIDGYGEVIDIIPTTEDRRLVVMTNGSVFIPK